MRIGALLYNSVLALYLLWGFLFIESALGVFTEVKIIFVGAVVSLVCLIKRVRIVTGLAMAWNVLTALAAGLLLLQSLNSADLLSLPMAGAWLAGSIFTVLSLKRQPVGTSSPTSHDGVDLG
jgi:hypothetical protein